MHRPAEEPLQAQYSINNYGERKGLSMILDTRLQADETPAKVPDPIRASPS